MKDIFISHAWGNDTLDRDNHVRCKLLADKLIQKGYSVWFDTYDLYGNIDSTIMNGINNCKIVLLCLTKKYCDKINNCAINQITNDNCYKEWNYSLFKQKIIIPILMEPCMVDIFLNSSGIIQMYLNSLLYIDLSHNLEDDFDILCKSIRHHSVYTKDEKSYYTGNSNSFTNFVNSITGLTVKSVSPRTIKILNRKFKHNKIEIDNYNKFKKYYHIFINKLNKNTYKKNYTKTKNYNKTRIRNIIRI